MSSGQRSGKHATCNLPDVAVVRFRPAARRFSVRQVREVLRNFHVPALDVLDPSRMALRDHILFAGPHDRPTELLDHAPPLELFTAVLAAKSALFGAHASELRAGLR